MPKEFANPIEAIDAALDDDAAPTEKDPEFEPDPDAAPDADELERASAAEEDDEAPEVDDGAGEAAKGKDPGKDPGEEPDADHVDGDGPEDKAEEGKEEKPDAKETKPEARPSDEFGELPKDVKQDTRDRFDKMKGRYDEVHNDLTAANQRIDQMVAVVQETGASAEQFNSALAYIKARNSNDPALLQEAYTVMAAELQAIGKVLGMEAPGGIDPLDEFEDLKKEVEDGGMTRKYALELASARKLRQLDESNREVSQQQSQQQGMLQQAYVSLNQLGRELQTADPEKWQGLIQNGQLETIMNMVEESGIEPTRWPEKVKALYDKLPKPVAAATAERKPNAPSPIRPSGATSAPGGGKVHKEPGSAMEAIDMALGL